MNVTHATHTSADIDAAIADTEAELRALQAEHGTFVEGSRTVAAKHDHTRAIARAQYRLGELRYEAACAAALYRLGIPVGTRVTIGPPCQPFGESIGEPAFGHDAITGRAGTVLRGTASGGDLLVRFDDGREDYAPTSRCTVVPAHASQ